MMSYSATIVAWLGVVTKMLVDEWKGITCLFCDEYEVVHISDKDWFLCLPCGLDYEIKKYEKEMNNEQYN